MPTLYTKRSQKVNEHLDEREPKGFNVHSVILNVALAFCSICTYGKISQSAEEHGETTSVIKVTAFG